MLVYFVYCTMFSPSVPWSLRADREAVGQSEVALIAVMYVWMASSEGLVVYFAI